MRYNPPGEAPHDAKSAFYASSNSDFGNVLLSARVGL